MEKLSLKEFVDNGILFEANRRFFHPIGLKLKIWIREGDEDVGFFFIEKIDDPGSFSSEEKTKAFARWLTREGTDDG